MTTLFLAIILAAVTATATPATATPAAASCPIITVIVRRGDTLGIIAGRYGTTTSVIYAANPGHDLVNLLVGQAVWVPACRPVSPRWPQQNTLPRRRGRW